MRIARMRPAALAALALAALAPATPSSDLKLDGQTTVVTRLGGSVLLELSGPAGQPFAVLIDVDGGPTPLFGQDVALGFTPLFFTALDGVLSATGSFKVNIPIPSVDALVGQQFFLVAAVFDPTASPLPIEWTNGVDVTITASAPVGHTELAGNMLAVYPHFETVAAFNQGSPVSAAVDLSQHPGLSVGQSGAIYVTEDRTAAEWDANPSLQDVTHDGPAFITFKPGGLAANTFLADDGQLLGDAGAGLGVGYDLVIDLNANGQLDAADLIDGYGDQAGLWVVDDLTQPGPYAVTEIVYSGGSWLGQNTYYPSNIASLGELPLVVVSHGNGHNYQWYDHIGEHLASYGYIVMSHQNNTVPGVGTASTTTLTNTDYFLGNLSSIAGGLLEGHVDKDTIVWIGHSRGGEGVAIAYDKLFDGDFTPTNFGIDDIKLVSSIAPTDFKGPARADPHGVPYHLWVGSSDSDVTGCADNNIAQSFHLHDRAEDERQAITLQGVGHGDFHDGGGSSWASGPCKVGRQNTHTIMRGYLLPLIKHHLEDNVPAEDFLWRQWESFKPIGAPTSSCVVVTLMHRRGEDADKFVVDDFQTNSGTALASSGATVTFDVTALTEGLNDDGNSNFTNNASDEFNGVTLGRNTDDTAGLVFSWDGVDRFLEFDLAVEDADVSGHTWLSFRTAQLTRHTLTIAALGDLSFEVELVDGSGRASTISVAAYGGGVEEPYARTSCGNGTGWGAEYETIRIRLADFLRDGSGLELADLDKIVLRFGPSHGSAEGRLGLDDLELTRN